jgi:hypothetical protein
LTAALSGEVTLLQAIPESDILGVAELRGDAFSRNLSAFDFAPSARERALPLARPMGSAFPSDWTNPLMAGWADEGRRCAREQGLDDEDRR